MTATQPTSTNLPSPGAWNIDPSHSSAEFVVRHLMVSKVKGRFGTFGGTLTVAEDPAASTVVATIEVGSVDTRDEKRDAHLRSADFFEADTYPTIDFASTGVRDYGGGDAFVLEGELTIKGVTRPVALDVECNGVGPDGWGGERVGFTATTEITRSDFGLNWNMALETGGVVVSDKVRINLEVEAIKQPQAS